MSEAFFHVVCFACKTEHLPLQECCACHPKADCILPDQSHIEKMSKKIRENLKREREVKHPEFYDEEAKETDWIKRID